MQSTTPSASSINFDSESYYQDRINRKYFGLFNLFEGHLLASDSSKGQFFIFIFLTVGIMFFAILLSYICLSMYLEFFPQDFTVGIYNYDAPLNYYFNPSYLSGLIVLFSVSIFLVITQVVLMFDVRKAKLVDSILNQGIFFVQHEQYSQLSNTELRELFDATQVTSIKSDFTDVGLAFGLITLLFLLVLFWILLKY